MGEDDHIVDLLWKSCRSSHTKRPSFDPPPILRDSGEGNAPLPQPSPPLHHQLQEDEMASWLYNPNRQDYFYSQLLSSVSMAQPPSLPPSVQYVLTKERPTAQVFATRRAENFMNFSTQTGNIFTSGVEARPSMQVSSSAVCEKVATETVCEIAGTKAIQIQTGTEIADNRKRKEREETISEIQETEEARGSTSRKRSRAAELHNLSERRRRKKINEKMKALQELIPRCSKTDKASMLDNAIEYVKSLQMQEQMMSMGHGMMPPMMHAGNIQQFMPHMAMGGMGMNRPPFIPFPGTPFPGPPDIAGLGPPYPAPRYPFPNVQTSDPSRVHVPTPHYLFPNIQTSDPSRVHLPTPHYPFPNIHTSDPSRVHLPTPQPNPVANRPQFPANMNPYSQFPGLHRMQQPPPPLQSQTTSQLKFSHDQGNQSTGVKFRS